MKKITFLLICSFFFVFGLTVTYAGEIQYASVQEIKGNEMILQYRSPSGPSNFICDLDRITCRKASEDESSFFPQEIFGQRNYQKSHDGNLALIEFNINLNSTDISYYSLFSLENETPQFRSLIPFYESTSRRHFTRDNKRINFFTRTNEVVAYDIQSNRIISRQNLPVSELHLLGISHQGKFLSTYNYLREVHQIVEIETGRLFEVESQTPYFVEFSRQESFVVFMDDRDGYANLFKVDLRNLASGETMLEAKKIIDGDFVVENFTSFDDSRIYYLTNERSPLEWSLYEYNMLSGEKKEISENVSYGMDIRKVDDLIVFPKIEGKNSDLYAYEPATGEIKKFEAVLSSPASNRVKREVREMYGLTTVLLSPNDTVSRQKELFVWLHGGPHRQISLNYHPYLSYAVYDEMLERLVENGAYVLKVDYTGSWGYGSEFMNGLRGVLGVADVADVVSSTRAIKNEFNINKVNLIGVSYGGYLALKGLVEEPELFSGAISINGVTDWRELVSRIPSSPFKIHFDGEPSPANEHLYAQASISQNLARLNDQKMLIVYGERDSTVPTWQSKEFYEIARSLGKNIEIASFENEDHIFRERANLNDLCRRVVSGFSINTGGINYCQ